MARMDGGSQSPHRRGSGPRSNLSKSWQGTMRGRKEAEHLGPGMLHPRHTRTVGLSRGTLEAERAEGRRIGEILQAVDIPRAIGEIFQAVDIPRAIGEILQVVNIPRERTLRLEDKRERHSSRSGDPPSALTPYHYIAPPRPRNSSLDNRS
jgi:hypothetical protein